MGLMIIPTLSIFVLVIFELSFPLIFANAMFYRYNLNVFLQDCFLRKKSRNREESSSNAISFPEYYNFYSLFRFIMNSK